MASSENPYCRSYGLLGGSRTLTLGVFKNAVAAEVEEIEKEKGVNIEFSDVMHLVMGDRGRQAERDILFLWRDALTLSRSNGNT